MGGGDSFVVDTSSIEEVFYRMNGTHYVCEFIDCQCDIDLLENPHKVMEDISYFIIKNKLTPCTSVYHSFDNGGFSGSIILAESHVNFHTWPETSTVNLDVYVCNYNANNTNKAHSLYKDLVKYFEPTKEIAQIIGRPSIHDNTWGYHLILDIYDGNDLIKSKDAIVDYTTKLCDLINMKRYGDCVAVHFGEDPLISGYSSFQLIETSCIAGHWVDSNNSAHIDIFSCKEFNPQEAITFTLSYFNAKDFKFSYLKR